MDGFDECDFIGVWLVLGFDCVGVVCVDLDGFGGGCVGFYCWFLVVWGWK